MFNLPIFNVQVLATIAIYVSTGSVTPTEEHHSIVYHWLAKQVR